MPTQQRTSMKVSSDATTQAGTLELNYEDEFYNVQSGPSVSFNTVSTKIASNHVYMST